MVIYFVITNNVSQKKNNCYFHFVLQGYYGIPLLFFVITIQIYTAVILGRCWIIAEKLNPTIINKNRYPYAAVAELIYGKYMSMFVTILLDVTVFGGGVPNLLVGNY